MGTPFLIQSTICIYCVIPFGQCVWSFLLIRKRVTRALNTNDTLKIDTSGKDGLVGESH